VTALFLDRLPFFIGTSQVNAATAITGCAELRIGWCLFSRGSPELRPQGGSDDRAATNNMECNSNVMDLL
jgi:hypothetical protein